MVVFGSGSAGDVHRFQCPSCRSYLEQPMSELASLVDVYRSDLDRDARAQAAPMAPGELASVAESACSFLRTKRSVGSLKKKQKNGK